MIIEIPDDNSIIKWKYNDSEDWKIAEISDLIKAYERPKGHWVEKQETPRSVSYYCSNCKCAGLGVENFCSWCGAEMRKEKDNGKS